MKTGTLTNKSYIPSGLTKTEYEKIRKADKLKKEKNYEMNVAKAFKFTDFTEWYTKRGTELNQKWVETVTLGHSMAKTKYDWSNTSDAKKFESTNVEKFNESFRVGAGRKVSANGRKVFTNSKMTPVNGKRAPRFLGGPVKKIKLF